MSRENISIELQAGALNGESPRWSQRESKLYWVDTRTSCLHVFDPSSKQDVAYEMPSWIGCCVLSDGGAIVALRTGLYQFHLGDGSLHQIAPAPYDVRRFLFNDGCCDPAGRFLVGEMYLPLAPHDQKEEAPKTAPLFRYSPHGSWIDLARPAKTSNGHAWSPDGRTMYQADTAKKTIYAFDYEVESGSVSNERVFATVETRADGHGPDGAAVDRDGFYLAAVFGEGCLLRFDPDGRLERRIELPVQYPTMPAFGGDDLSTIYVTSATWKIEHDARPSRPLEGSLLSLPAPVPGLPTTLFDRTRF